MFFIYYITLYLVSFQKYLIGQTIIIFAVIIDDYSLNCNNKTVKSKVTMVTPSM